MSRLSIEAQLQGMHATAPPRLLTAVELGTGLVDGYARFESSLGEVVVAFNPTGVSAVDLFDQDFEARFRSRFRRPLLPAQPPRGWQKSIGRALELGTPGDLPIDFAGLTKFQRQVLELAATIPRGEVRPYSWLAKRAGKEGAARAVGSTMARNPVPLIVPCHRVVRSDGRIGEYSLGGPHNKWSLLEAEGARPGELEHLAGAGFRFKGSETTHVYCLPTCSQARRVKATEAKFFRTKESAESTGYRACQLCQP